MNFGPKQITRTAADIELTALTVGTPTNVSTGFTVLVKAVAGEADRDAVTRL